MQDFDAQATIQVQAMLERLETFLYHESDSLPGHSQLFDECTEWSSLFPHLRVRGRQILPTNDAGYELIPYSQVRCRSPYFCVPEYPLASRSTSSNDSHPLILGIGLSNDIVVTRNPPDAQLDGMRKGAPENTQTFYGAQSIFDWSDGRTQDAIKVLKDMKEKDGKLKWYLFRYRTRPPASAGDSPGMDEDERSSTPTPDDPHGRRARTPTPRSENRQTNRCCVVEVVASGTGNMDAMKKQIGAAGTKEANDHGLFVVMSIETKQLTSLAGGRNILGEPRMRRAGATTHGLIFIDWDEGPDSNIEVIDIETKAVLDTLEPTEVADAAVSQRKGVGCRLNVYDVMMALGDVDCAVFEYQAPSMGSFVKTPVENVILSLALVDDCAKPWSDSNFDEVFEADGEIEEWFAHDNMGDDNIDDKDHIHYSHKRKGIPPVTPNASIRQDILGHVFDDVWSEIIPTFQPLMDSLANEFKRPGQAADGNNDLPTAAHEHDFADDNVDAFLDNEDLLSAMTIRPVPLQKRESSARIRSTHDPSLAYVVEPYPTSRPTSARPTSARPTSGRAPSTRPTSARNLDMFQHHQGHGATLRLGSAAPNKAVGQNWKRFVFFNADAMLSGCNLEIIKPVDPAEIIRA
ncbi:hypothetical protein HK104_006250 [Borealophlyctis nickersoniae]|nr:hypothetical protein HK104_006250 [Borealophlyctis nickersoniae]